MSNKTSDKNVDSIKRLKQMVEMIPQCDFPKFQMDYDNSLLFANDLENILAEREQKDKRIKKLEEENKKLKAQHVFTRNEATDKEKAKLYDTIDKTLDTFLENKKTMWEQEMTADKMNLEEALNIVDAMYQDRYKVIEEKNKDGITIHVNKIDDVRFTNLEFASVRLLREVQRLQRNLSNSISKQEVKEKFEKIQSLYEKNLVEVDLKEVEKIDRKIFEGIRLEAQRDLARELLQESEDK